MDTRLEILKGIHPGFVLERELKKRHIKKGAFALSIHEYPQTITSITKGKRDMNLPLSLRIEKELQLEEGFLMTLQLYHDIEKEKQKSSLKPDFTKLRPILFWDTKMENINWQKQKKAIVMRVFERGNELEKGEIVRFYGKAAVDSILRNTSLHALL